MKAVPGLFLAAGTALLGGCLGFVLLTALSAPGLYRDPMFVIGFAVRSAPFVMLVYLLAPVVVLSAMAVAQGRALTIWTCIAVPACWLLMIFLLWAYKPWHYYGEFPWRGFNRHFVQVLPPMLATGWLFWRAQVSRDATDRRNVGDR